MNKTIALSMIVRNEGARLAHCLDSVKGHVDEIVIVDTGSTDNTVDIARQYTEKVFYYAWSNDFSAARNFALAQTNSEWILSLDADEQLDATAGDIRALVNQPEKEAFCLPLYALEESCDRQYDRFLVLRLFKNRYCFRGTIHEQIIIEDSGVLDIAASPVIWHAAIPSKERRIRRGRNIALLQKALQKDSDNPFLLYYYGVDWLGLGRTDKAIPCFEQVLLYLKNQQPLFRAPAIRYLIDCYKAQGELDKAICLCLDECLRYSRYTDLYFEGGVLFELKGEYQIAAQWFKEALQHGKPEAVFHHTDGTENYLSLHHLGYCLEKQGLYKQARESYMRALAANKQYIYPLYQLMQLDLSRQQAAVLWENIQRQGYLTDASSISSVADFLWESGFPDLAYACMKKNSSAISEPLLKYGIYSGHTREALSGIDEFRTLQELSISMAVDEIVALLIMQDLKTAKSRTLCLWRSSEGRSAAWAMLNLTHMMDKGTLCGTPEPHRHQEVAQVLMDVLDRCWRSRIKDVAMQASMAKVKTTIMDILLFYPQTAMLLASYLQEQANRVRQILSYNFEAVRGLYA